MQAVIMPVGPATTHGLLKPLADSVMKDLKSAVTGKESEARNLLFTRK